MPLYDDSETMLIENEAELASLPLSVTKVEIETCSVSQLSLPWHVKQLYLREVEILGAVVLGEGLEEIHFEGVTTALPLSDWVFPASLKLASFRDYHGSVLDLKTVTAATICLYGLGASKQAVILPEALDHLVIDGRYQPEAPFRVAFPKPGADLGLLPPGGLPVRFVNLPARLRALTLANVANIEILDESQTESLSQVTLEKVGGYFRMKDLFPEVESLSLKEMRFYIFPKLNLPRLRELTIERCSSSYTVALKAANLESLTIINGTRELDWIVLDCQFPSNLGPHLRSLILVRVPRLPLVSEWEALEELSITGLSKYLVFEEELPFIPLLGELTIDWPLITNNYEVRDLDEYKQAWGLRTRRKGAASAINR